MDPAHTIDELTRRNVAIIAAMEKHSQDIRTRGERIADLVAERVGSWPFIIVQSTLLTIWIILNLVGWWKHWDPYPFILLNLVLSFQAAYCAPIIMISQNRQARLAERRNHLDLQINLLAEQETTEIIRMLRLLCDHAGIDHRAEPEADVLAEATAPDKIIEQIQGEIEHKTGQDVEAESPTTAAGQPS